MTYVLSPRAQTDIEGIWDYTVERWGEEQAIRYMVYCKMRSRRLPGDFYVKRGNFSFYFPLASSIIVSIILTLLLAFFRR